MDIKEDDALKALVRDLIQEAKYEDAKIEQRLVEYEIRNLESLLKVAKADPPNIQEVAVLQLEINSSYYKSVLLQSQHSFRSALIWASIGTFLIIVAVIFLVIQQPANLSYVSLIGGVVVEAIAGLNFYLYGRASNQLTVFQSPLDRIGRFLLANSVCENLEGEIKHSTRAELVRLIMDFSVPNNEEKKKNEQTT